MHNSTPYINKIIHISHTNGVELNDDEALEVLARLVELVRVVHGPELSNYGTRKQRGFGEGV